MQSLTVTALPRWSLKRHQGNAADKLLWNFAELAGGKGCGVDGGCCGTLNSFSTRMVISLYALKMRESTCQIVRVSPERIILWCSMSFFTLGFGRIENMENRKLLEQTSDPGLFARSCLAFYSSHSTRNFHFPVYFSHVYKVYEVYVWPQRINHNTASGQGIKKKKCTCLEIKWHRGGLMMLLTN